VKVILTDDIEKLGGSNELVEVAEGYARNYLFPRSLAVPATKSALANLENMRKITERRNARLKGAAEELAASLAGKTVKIPAKAGTGGKIYGSVSANDIAKQLHADFGIELDKKQISLHDAIRAIGLYAVTLNLHRDVKPTLTVQVGDAPEGGFAPLETAETAEAAEVAA
jgi:large subunit ribosomal protein L9